MLILLMVIFFSNLPPSAHTDLSFRQIAARDDDHNSPISVKPSVDPYTLHAVRRQLFAIVMLPMLFSTNTLSLPPSAYSKPNGFLAYGSYILFSTPPPAYL